MKVIIVYLGYLSGHRMESSHSGWTLNWRIKVEMTVSPDVNHPRGIRLVPGKKFEAKMPPVS